jgi:hypothetical protein
LSKETDIIGRILTELRTISDSPFSKPSADGMLEIPGWISAGDDESLIINSAISGWIGDLSSYLHDADPSLARSISVQDWAEVVRRVLGPILGATDLDDSLETSSEVVLASLRDELTHTNWNFNKRTFLFGCSLIEHHEISPFSVGPVTIWNRSNWLNHALAEGRIARVTHQRVAATWSGRKLRRRKPSLESSNENDILDATGMAPYICSVETEGLFGEFAKEKALLAARLTLLGVGLMWSRPSKALKEINLVYDGPPYRQTYAYFQDRPEILGGSRWIKSLHGVSLFGDMWEPLIAQRNSWWAILAETLEFLLSNDGQVVRPRLMNSFAHSLIWLHEACREPTPMIAVTKFMASLDALAGGSGSGGIIDLVCARIGQDRTSPIRAGGPTFSAAIKNLYKEGRSRPIHGGSDRLGYDWQDQRELAESLARICMIFCFDWAAANPSCDDLKVMARP